MKEIAFVILALCVLAAWSEGGKSDRTDTRTDRPSTYEAQDYPNQSFWQYSNSGSDAYPCYVCSGSGRVTCNVCRGTGENSSYQYYSPVLKGFSKLYCEGCNGSGWVTCGRCHGTGLD